MPRNEYPTEERLRRRAQALRQHAEGSLSPKAAHQAIRDQDLEEARRLRPDLHETELPKVAAQLRRARMLDLAALSAVARRKSGGAA